MFRRLRNRFLLMNMGIISLIMLMAFGAIFTITYRNTANGIQKDLLQLEGFNHKPGGPKEEPEGGPGNRDRPGREMHGMPRLPSVFITMQTDGQWAVTETDSPFDVDTTVYNAALSAAKAGLGEFGRFTIDGTRWAYHIMRVPTGYSLVSMEVTAQQAILSNLIYTFAAVACVMLGVIYLASRYFAERSILPVKEAFDKQKQFIADASHELKTPLTVINTSADVLLMQSEAATTERSKWLNHIKSEAERMKVLTNDLLYLAEMDIARSPVIHVQFDLSEAVEGVILTMEPIVFEKKLTLDYNIEPGLSCHGNREQIKQVVVILLDNAIKYADSHGTVELALKKHQGHTLLTVSNSGPGIPPEHLDRIFDRFYRADGSRSRQNGGHGLGLAIAKSIVEHHRGRIYARSVPNELTTFYVQL